MEAVINKTIKATKQTELITLRQFAKDMKKIFNAHELCLIQNALMNGKKITSQLAEYKLNSK
jgi:hypothetical protein